MESNKLPGHRQQILISGEANWCRSQALQLLGDRAAMWITEHAPDTVDAVTAAGCTSLLGGETDWLVYDGHCGFDPDAFGAVSGIVRGGGGLLLLMPVEQQQTTSRFIKRLSRCIANDSNWLINPQQLLKSVVNEVSSPIVVTDDQQQAIDAVCRVATGHRRRPVVLIADRGRGKSAALGMAAARLLKEGRQRILVTAPRRDAVAALFDHAARGLDDARVQRNLLSWETGTIQYIAPDVLLQHPVDSDLLLVDEAAGIPVPMLEQLLACYSRVAFATTVHGYEGAGQGFAVRFTRLLDKHCRQWRQVDLQEPVRWSAGDPLERFVFDALLLDAEPAEIDFSTSTQLEIHSVDRDALLQDELQLRELFGLLISAHYRTTPKDLQELLDSPDMGIFIACDQGHVVGVLLYANEGGLDAGLGLAISEGRRRVKGHLLPQVLAAQLGFAAAVEQNILRIVRIAVHGGLRRQGVASSLLDALHAYGEAQQVDMLGASFGATPGLLHFWQQTGFVPVRLGMRREASSGAHAVLMLQACSGPGAALQQQLLLRFRENILLQLAGPLRKLEPSVVVALIDGLGLTEGILDQELIQQLHAFAEHHRGYEDCLGALQALLLRALYDRAYEINTQSIEALVQKILQGRGWAVVVAHLKLTGKAEVLDSLRSAVQQALDD